MKTWSGWSTVIETLDIFMFVLTVRVNYWLILCFWNIFPSLFFVVWRSLCVQFLKLFLPINDGQVVVISLLLPLWDLGGLNCKKPPKKDQSGYPQNRAFRKSSEPPPSVTATVRGLLRTFSLEGTSQERLGNNDIHWTSVGVQKGSPSQLPGPPISNARKLNAQFWGRPTKQGRYRAKRGP